VPTLWDMLTPPEDRPSSFYVGSIEFDAEKIGFRTDAAGGGYLFETHTLNEDGDRVPIPGNSNQGHDFGTQLPDSDKKALIEYLKSL